jgi:DnaJ-class molecular chaperone
MDLYHILGVTSDASQEEIKRSYHQLAKKYHPDRNKEKGAEENFKDISHAYSVLSDLTKRRQYNISGNTEIENDDSIEVDDIIPYDFEVELEYEDFIIGGKKNFRVSESIMIDDKGDEILLVICPMCKGKIKISNGFRIKCNYCQETGQIYNKSGTIQERLHEFDLDIEPRSWIGRVVPWKNKKVLLTAKDEENNRLQHDENLLIYTYPITIFHSLIGLMKEIKILDKVHKIDHPEIIKPESHIVIKDAGLFDFRGNRGDLMIEFEILYPKKITKKQWKYLEKCVEIDRENQ